MRQFSPYVRGVLTATLLVGWAGLAAAQVARAGGIVRDDAGQPIKGATIRADNPDAPLSTITSATDEKGRFAIIGLARGVWSFVAEAPGFQPQFAEMNIQRTATPNPPLTFILQKALVRPPAGVEGVTAKDLQQQLAWAEGLFNQQKFEDAIGVYRMILASAPSLGMINLQIAAAFRNMKQYDKAIAAYDELLKAEPDDPQARVGMAMANLEKGDIQAAERVLARAAEAPGANRDVFFNLAEIKVKDNQSDEAAKWYQKAADADPSWGKPLFKLGTIAMARGDKQAAMRTMAQVIAVDPTSPEAAQAKTALDELQK